MSRITFTSPSGEADLCGRERAYMSVLTGDLALAALRLDGWHMRERFMQAVDPKHYLHGVRFTSEKAWADSASVAWRVGDLMLDIDGQPCDAWHFTLNTAVAAGSDEIELLARIHATCEIHGYVEGEHRAWLADMIAEGLNQKILRRPPTLRDWGTWEGVETFLRSNDNEPVVMSYSVTESFPNPYVADWEPSDPDDEDDEEWSALPDERRWDLAMAGLRKRAGSIDLHPEMWGVRGFGPLGWSVFDLVEWLHSDDRTKVATT